MQMIFVFIAFFLGFALALTTAFLLRFSTAKLALVFLGNFLSGVGFFLLNVVGFPFLPINFTNGILVGLLGPIGLVLIAGISALF